MLAGITRKKISSIEYLFIIALKNIRSKPVLISIEYGTDIIFTQYTRYNFSSIEYQTYLLLLTKILDRSPS